MKKIILMIALFMNYSYCFAERYTICITSGRGAGNCISIQIAHPNFCDLGLLRSGVRCWKEGRVNSGATSETPNNIKNVTYKSDSKTGITTFYFNNETIFEVPKSQLVLSKDIINQIEVAKKSNQASNNIK